VSSKTFGAAFFFGGLSVAMTGMQLWFASTAMTGSAVRAFELALIVAGCAVATAGIRATGLGRRSEEE
jgi:hypothetical protein